MSDRNKSKSTKIIIVLIITAVIVTAAVMIFSFRNKSSSSSAKEEQKEAATADPLSSPESAVDLSKEDNANGIIPSSNTDELQQNSMEDQIYKTSTPVFDWEEEWQGCPDITAVLFPTFAQLNLDVVKTDRPEFYHSHGFNTGLSDTGALYITNDEDVMDDAVITINSVGKDNGEGVLSFCNIVFDKDQFDESRTFNLLYKTSATENRLSRYWIFAGWHMNGDETYSLSRTRFKSEEDYEDWKKQIDEKNEINSDLNVSSSNRFMVFNVQTDINSKFVLIGVEMNSYDSKITAVSDDAHYHPKPLPVKSDED